jgi:hypothetical protein
MKNHVLTLCFVFVIVAAVVFSGCETASVSNDDLTITPVSTGLHNGEYADFTASGGFDYTWSLQNPTWGVLSNLTGPTTRYTDRYDPGSNGNASTIQVLTLTSTIQGSSSSSNGSSSTNTAPYSNLTTAQIEHLPTSATGGGTTNTTSAVSIDPTSASLAFGSSKTFTASGGNAPYSWSIDSTNGTLSISGANLEYGKVTCSVNLGLSGSNAVSRTDELTVTDSTGTKAFANVTFFGN